MGLQKTAIRCFRRNVALPERLSSFSDAQSRRTLLAKNFSCCRRQSILNGAVEFDADYFRSYFSRAIRWIGFLVAVAAGYVGGIWWLIGVFIVASIIAYLIGDPIKEQKAKLEAYYKQMDAQAPFHLAEFKVSTDARYYPVKLTTDQAIHCAHKLARELSIEFVGLKVWIVQREPESSVPRRMFRQGADYGFQVRKKTADDPLDLEEQKFMPRLEQLKIRCAVEAKDGMRMSEAIEDAIPNEPEHGTKRADDFAFGWTPCSMYYNERYYCRGQFTRRRGWESIGKIHFSERR